jgi:soluble lytic murein transglycosylase
MFPRKHRPKHKLASRLALLVIASLFTVAIAACGGGSSTPSPTEVPSPVLSPAPSGTVIDFAKAKKMYHDGDFEGALTIYSAAALNGSAEQKQTGLWEMAKVQFQRGEYSDAEATARAFRATKPAPDLDRQALLLLGSAQLQQGELAPARQSLEAYAATNGPALPYAKLYLAQVDQAEGKSADSIARLNEVIAADLPPHINYTALVALAQSDEQAQDHTAGVRDYRRAADAATTSSEGAEALWYLADAASTGGDEQTASDTLGELIRTYPSTQRAADASKDSRLKPGALSELDRGLFLFHQQNNDDATTTLQGVADAGGADAPTAQYYLGILSERAEDWNGAIDHYDAAIRLLDTGANPTLKAQAYWDIATVLERTDQRADAIANYAKVADVDATHLQAAEGLFRAGFLAYNLGQFADSLTYWNRLATIATTTGDKARANYWLSAAQLVNGDAASAAVSQQNAIRADALDYYAMRAQANANLLSEFPDASTLTPPAAPNWTTVEAWLGTFAGTEPSAATTITTDAPFARAVELHNAGFTELADEQWKSLLAENSSKPWQEYRLLREISNFDRPGVTVAPALDLAEENPNAPKELLQLAYPLAYWDIVQKEAQANSISPLLLLALVRQESLYTPDAVSSVGATGLTQIVDTTAAEIAQQLGVTDYKPTDLLRPNVSLKFGARYLSGSLGSFDGALPPGVAGYNAGPGTAAGWWDTANADPDLFLETIEFSETRSFVELVLENYARYLYAYGLLPQPELPLG